MQASLANAVHALFTYGLALRAQIDAGEPIDWDDARRELNARLAVFHTDEPDTRAKADFVFSEQGNPEDHVRLTRDTVRYALACWLDDQLTSVDMPAWGERSLENELFGSNEAARFWDEARYAETRGDLDALEVIYLCMMLGLRGSWRHEPAELAAWLARIGSKFDQATLTWTMPIGRKAPSHDGARADDLPLRRMAFSVLLALSLVVPAIVALWWRNLHS